MKITVTFEDGKVNVHTEEVANKEDALNVLLLAFSAVLNEPPEQSAIVKPAHGLTVIGGGR